ncbi:MAG: hypothetical protein Q9202_005881 [Teloschistes flavicans]
MPSPPTDGSRRHRSPPSNPHSHSRSRSRSPPPRRRTDSSRPKANRGGFRWKDKSLDADQRNDRSADDRRLERGYRDRDRRERDEYRERYRDGGGGGDRDREERGDNDSRQHRDRNDDRDRSRERSRRRSRRDDDRYRDGEQRRRKDDDDDNDDISNRPQRRDSPPGHDAESPIATAPTPQPSKKEKKKSKKPSIAPVAEAMIIVNVNDRLGTKASIPCLPSDIIRDFKNFVARAIGREPHEIMLKRQGERPFKDVLTLEDYGVSNGVQLDLEVDTGD